MECRAYRPMFARPLGRPDETALPLRILRAWDAPPPFSQHTARARAIEALGDQGGALEMIGSTSAYYTFRQASGEMVNVYRDGEVWKTLVIAPDAPYFHA